MKKQIITTFFLFLPILLFAQKRLDFQNILKNISVKPINLSQVKKSLESEPQLQKIDNRDFYYFSNIGVGVQLMDVDEAISDVIIYPKIYVDSFSKPFFYKKNLSLIDVSQQQGASLFIRWEKSSNSLLLTYQDTDENKFIYKAIIKETSTFTDGPVSYSYFVSQLKTIGNTLIETIKVDLNGFKMPASYISPPPMVHFNDEIPKTARDNNENFNSAVKVDSVGNKFWKVGGRGEQKLYNAVVDGNGNIYLAIHFDKEVICENRKFFAKGKKDVLICKYNNDGKFLWGTQIQVNEEGTLADNAKLSIDRDNNLYFSGLCGSPIKTDNLIIGQARFNVFVIKFDNIGKPLWKQEINSEHYATYFNTAEVDEMGNFYLIFSFAERVAIGKYTLKSKDKNTLGLVKYNSNGEIILHKALANSEFYFSGSISKTGNISLCHRTRNEDFIDGKVSFESSKPNFMVLKYDSNGYLLFQKQIQILGIGHQDVLEDKKGNLLLVGGFTSMIKYNENLFESESLSNKFIIKLNNEGNIDFFRHIAGKEFTISHPISIDEGNNIVFLDNVSGLVKTESEGLIPSYSGKRTVFISYNENGQLQEIKQFSDGLNDRGVYSKFGVIFNRNDVFIIIGTFNEEQNVGFTTIKPDNQNDILIGLYKKTKHFVLDKTASKAVERGLVERTEVANKKGDSIRKTSGNGINNASEVAFDKLGNKYIYGTCGDIVRIGGFRHFAPNIELFVAKFNKNDSLVWFKTIRRESYAMLPSETGSLRIDNDGNIIISGAILGVNTADNLKVTANEFSKKQDFGCYFLSKIDTNGSFLWFKNIGIEEKVILNNTNFFELDKNNNIYFVAKIKEQTFNNKQVVGELRQTDFCISKYDKNGNQLWFKVFGSEIDDKVEDVEITKEGDLYLVGNVGKNVRFDQQKFSMSNPQNGFIAKLNNNGMLINIQNIFSDAAIKKLKITQNGEYFISGDFKSSIKYKNLTLNSDGWQDSFVGLLDKNMFPKWLNRLGTSSYESVNDITFDKLGNLYALFFQTDNDKSKASVISKYSTKGNLEWSKAIKSTELIFSNNICLDNNGNICLVGAFQKEMCFDGNCLYSLGYKDFFWTSFSTK